MPVVMQSIFPLSSSYPRTRWRSPSVGSPPPTPPKSRYFCMRGRRSEDDYHATLRALKSRGRIPRKSLGQHYMLNSSINEQLASVAEVKHGDVILEIGPGTGSLTNVLLNAGATVVAVEKDSHMAMLMRDRFEGTDQLMVLQEDFTKCHIHSHLTSLLESRKSASDNSKFAKVVSNIPFNISTDVVKLLLPMGDIFSEVILLLQDETALRFVEASLGTSEYRPINIFVNFYSDPKYEFKVSKANFFPQPNVDAAVVTFKLKQPAEYPHVASAKSFFSMVNSAFNGKRKMLRRSLQHICSSVEIEKALEKAGLPVTSLMTEICGPTRTLLRLWQTILREVESKYLTLPMPSVVPVCPCIRRALPQWFLLLTAHWERKESSHEIFSRNLWQNLMQKIQFVAEPILSRYCIECFFIEAAVLKSPTPYVIHSISIKPHHPRAV